MGAHPYDARARVGKLVKPAALKAAVPRDVVGSSPTPGIPEHRLGTPVMAGDLGSAGQEGRRVAPARFLPTRD